MTIKKSGTVMIIGDDDHRRLCSCCCVIFKQMDLYMNKWYSEKITHLTTIK